MKNSSEKDARGFSGSRAVRAAAALLCLCIAGGLIIYSLYNAVDRNDKETGSENTLSGSEEPQDISVSGSIPVTDSAGNGTSGENRSSDDTQTGGSKDISVMPAEGNIIRDYSGEGLSYSETLNQYISHKAVDIGTSGDAAAAAVESGTVLSVEDDDRYGLTVVISHGNGLETTYACLSDSCVSAGDVVNKGDRIGTAGGQSLFESADDPHLHFAAHKNGQPVNPHELWNW